MKRLVPILVVAVLALAGCSNESDKGDSGDPDDKVASLSGDKPAAGAPADDQDLSDEEAVAAFGKCMRENGMPDFPDPTLDERGVRFNGDPQTYMSQPEAQAAMGTCNPLIAQIQQEFMKKNPGAMQDSMQKVIECVREKGYDVPDPIVQDDGSIRINQPEGIDHDAFSAAMDECQRSSAESGGQQP